MGKQLIAEVYAARQTAGEPLATVAGDEARVLAKAARIAAERGRPVLVQVAGSTQTWCVSVHGSVVVR